MICCMLHVVLPIIHASMQEDMKCRVISRVAGSCWCLFLRD